MKFEVQKIDKSTAETIVSNKHYSKRLGIFWEGFGLFDSGKLIGVVCFGQPSAPIQKHAFKDRNFRLYELTRLVVDDGIKNAASFLISKALKMLTEQPSAVISYADSAQGHCGIVYQATNWIYTGSTVSHDKIYVVSGVKMHPMTIRDKFGVTEISKWAKENGIESISPEPKHRYFYFNGNKYQKREMVSKLSYPIISSYPKADYSTYKSEGNCSDFINGLF